VVGARPNFMKLAPVARALAHRPVRHAIVHTGQHYDPEMSDTFFHDLALPRPDAHLGVGSGSHAQQTAAVMASLEPVLLQQRPDLVLVYGDVNSTVAAALVAAKLGIPVGHVEAGLRSRDWSMPEEINRVVTDRLANLLFTPSRDAGVNLAAEGVPAARIHFVGNVMIDSLVTLLPQADHANGHVAARGDYILATLHRPANVDALEAMREVLGALDDIALDHPVLFPVHPRTRARIAAAGWAPRTDRFTLLDPVSYVTMLGLTRGAGLVITDSGGVQEETTYLGVPCLTVRPNTERPITCTEGTNRLVPASRDAIKTAVHERWGARRETPCTIERWDGQAGERIAAVICEGARFD
jgi:UDP-N-acetylglucosamine 2-epimerase (non-hydrolysing)